jgi:outer membrane protein
MQFRRLVPLAVLFVIAMAPAGAVKGQAADSGAGPVLSLDEAIALAARNNPEHLQLVNDRGAAAAAKRAAYGAFLPSADLSFTGQYRKEGAQPINGVTFSTDSDIYQSSYTLGLRYNISRAMFLNPRLQSANVDAVEADIAGSQQNLRATVAQQYFTVLQSQANAQLQDTLVSAAQLQLDLSRARAAVGSATQLDVARAEVALGQAQVAALRAHNQVDIDMIRLFQTMGVPQPPNTELVTAFPVSEPGFSLESVLEMAQRQNPGLEALRARDRVASLNVGVERSQYFPSLSLSTGWGGYTYQYTNDNFLVGQAQVQRASCFQRDSIRAGVGLAPLGGCGSPVLSQAEVEAIQSENDQFPFDFTRQPMSLTAVVSLPLFDGFTREQRVQEAVAQRNDARYQVRARQLQLSADVTAAYLTLVTQLRAVEIQERNAVKAREELALAQERYRVGSGSFLDVSDARSAFERAESERITAVYEYHKAFAALESAVGRPLR